MKKLLSIFLLSSLFSATYSNPPDLKISSYTAVSKSKSKEIIFTESTSEKLSELVWNENPAVKIGVSPSVKIKNLRLKANFIFAVPNSWGTMTDSDWNLNGLKTTYSIHEEKTKNDLSASFDLFYDFSLYDKLLFLSPGFSFSYNFLKFEGRNGYGWYGNSEYSLTGKDEAWNSGNARKAKKVAGIDYERHSFVAYLSFSCSLNTEKFSANLGFKISPVSYYDVLDYHYSKNSSGYRIKYIFISHFKNIGFKLGLDYRLNKHVSINLNGTYEKQFLDYGTMFSDYYSTGHLSKTNQQCGIEFSDLAAFLGITFSLGTEARTFS